jgi:hypothetical protein
MLTVFGVKPARLIETVTVADDAGAASTRASAETTRSVTLRICGTPLIKRLLGSFPGGAHSDAQPWLKVRKRFVSRLPLNHAEKESEAPVGLRTAGV